MSFRFIRNKKRFENGCKAMDFAAILKKETRVSIFFATRFVEYLKVI